MLQTHRLFEDRGGPDHVLLLLKWMTKEQEHVCYRFLMTELGPGHVH